MLKRRKESDTYLVADSGHRRSPQIAMKVDKVCSFQPALRPLSAEEDADEGRSADWKLHTLFTFIAICGLRWCLLSLSFLLLNIIFIMIYKQEHHIKMSSLITKYVYRPPDSASIASTNSQYLVIQHINRFDLKMSETSPEIDVFKVRKLS